MSTSTRSDPIHFDLESLLTAAQVAHTLGISVKTVYSYVSRGLLPYVKIQSNVRFRPDAIQRWVQEHEYVPKIR